MTEKELVWSWCPNYACLSPQDHEYQEELGWVCTRCKKVNKYLNNKGKPNEIVQTEKEEQESRRG